MQILRLAILFITSALSLSVAITLFLEQQGRYSIGYEVITDWGFVIHGHSFGLVEYRGAGMNGDLSEMSTVLQLGRVKLLMAPMDIYNAASLLSATAVLFFTFGIFGLRKAPAFGIWLRTVVTMRNLCLSVFIVSIAGTVFVTYWFSPPRQWSKMRRGMSQQEVLASMPDWVADMRCTYGGDWVHRDRYLLGIEKRWIMRVTYDAQRHVLTAATTSINSEQEQWSSLVWTDLPLH